MDAPDKVDSADQIVTVKKRGRPAKKQDLPSPIGQNQIETAKVERERNANNPVVETFYELRNSKLSLCKRKKTGSVYRTHVGMTNDKDPARFQQMQAFVKKLEKEGRLKHRI